MSNLTVNNKSIVLADAIQSNLNLFECKKDAQIIATVIQTKQTIRAIWAIANEEQKLQTVQSLAASICHYAELYCGKTENTDFALWLECARYLKDNHAGLGVSELQLVFTYAAKNSTENTLWTKSFTVMFFGKLLENYQAYRNRIVAQINQLQQKAEQEAQNEDAEQKKKILNERARLWIIQQYQNGAWQDEADIPAIAVEILKSMDIFAAIDAETKKIVWGKALQDTMLYFHREISQARKLGIDTMEMEKAAQHVAVRYNVQILQLNQQLATAPIESQIQLQAKLNAAKLALSECQLPLPQIVLQKARTLFGKRLILDLIESGKNVINHQI